MGNVRTQLQANVADEKPEQSSAVSQEHEEYEVEQGAEHDQRAATAEARSPTIGERTGYRLDQHRDEEAGKRQQAQVRILACVWHVVEQHGRQDDGMQ